MRALAAVRAAAILLVMTSCAASQQQQPASGPPINTSQAAAQRGLETMRALARQGNFAALGFTSAQEAEAATLDAPLHVFMVRLDQLQQYRPGTDPASLLQDTGQDFYPVLVGGQVRSSLRVSGADGRFAAVSFGGAALARTLGQRRQDLTATLVPPNGEPPQRFEVVHVAALNLYFLGFEQRGQLMLSPAINTEQFGFRAGVPQWAAAVFTRLSEQARTMRPDVPT